MDWLKNPGRIVMLVVCLMALSTPAAYAQSRSNTDIDPYREFLRANKLVSAGAYTRSVPHYENVLKAAPERYPLAHFNLAEVWRFKKDCHKAAVLYQAYMALGQDPEVLDEAKQGLKECKGGEKWATLAVKTNSDDARIRVDGYIVARGETLEGVSLPEGTYSVEVGATDHHGRFEKVKLEAGEASSLDLPLKKMTFHGTLIVKVNVEGVTIKIEPKELDAPNGPTDVHTKTSPMEEELRLVTGKYFIEVTHEDYHRWIRNVRVERDQKTEVNVTLDMLPPPEIRF